MLNHDSFEDFRRLLPRAGGFLSKTGGRLDGEALTVFDHSLIRGYMCEESLQDKVVSEHGLTENMPFVRGEQERYDDTRGMRVYQCHGSEVKYVECTIPNATNHPWMATLRYYVVAKEEEEAFRKHLRDQRVLAVKDTQPPVLPPGLLEDVIHNTVEALLKKKEAARYGVRVCRGILLDGEPGNGKTMICRWIKKLCIENDILYGHVSAGEIDYRYHHGGRQVYDLFNTYTVTFFDDVGMSFLTRMKGHDEKACDILSAMDGIDECKARIRIFTTNEAVFVDNNLIDPAFLRPGRIDYRCYLRKPNQSLRKKLVRSAWPQEIKDYLKGPLLTDFLKKTKGYSFADLEAIRRLLVDEKVMGSGEWCIDTALTEFESQRDNKKVSRKSTGF